MYEITRNSTLNEVEQIPALRDLRDQLLVQPSPMAQRFKGMPFSGMRVPGQENRVDAMLHGLQHLLACAETGRKIRWQVWSPEDVAQQPDREQAQLLHLPGKPGAPFVVVCAGGGYQCIVTYTEGLMAAAELNAAGYHAFVLNYRVRQKQLMPKPIDDLAQAIRLILQNADALGVDKRYAVMGFSAGGHLAAEWGTVNCGYSHYGLPAPAALLLCYPAIDLHTLHGNQTADELYANLQDANGSVDSYCVNLHMDKTYPPTYLWQCEDDDVVDFANYRILCEALERYQIPHKARSYARGGHGLSHPHDPEADRWMDDVLVYLSEQLPVMR